MTPQERRRVIELFEQWRTGSLNEETVEIIHKEMSHLTAAEVAHVLLVNEEEKKLDAAVETAEAEASCQIAEILVEVQQTFGLEQAPLEVAIPVLCERKEQGDKPAAELLKRLINAFENANISGEEP
jgi:hypothetical protein